MMARTADNGSYGEHQLEPNGDQPHVRLTEDSSRSIVTGKTGLAHTRSIVESALLDRKKFRSQSATNARINTWVPINTGRGGQIGRISSPRHHKAYPLSMTRAATSSAMGNQY
jgi:hypothetical protein